MYYVVWPYEFPLWRQKEGRDELWALFSGSCFTKTTNLMHNYVIQGIHRRMVRFQKLTRNLFLTLHGHNVHRQQQQLSKFLMRYQQFASHAYCGAAEAVSKMASQQEKAFCLFRFEVSWSMITVQREFRCTVITDLDTSKRSTQKAFSCCDAILETGSAAPQ